MTTLAFNELKVIKSHTETHRFVLQTSWTVFGNTTYKCLKFRFETFTNWKIVEFMRGHCSGFLCVFFVGYQ